MSGSGITGLELVVCRGGEEKEEAAGREQVYAEKAEEESGSARKLKQV